MKISQPLSSDSVVSAILWHRPARMKGAAISLAVAGLLSVTASHAAPASYRFETLTLPDAPGLPNYISSVGINNRGQVFGRTWDSRVVLWNPGTSAPVTLSPSLGNGSMGQLTASAMNDPGVIAGYVTHFSVNPSSTGELWREGGTFAPLAVPSGFTGSTATGINNAGQVAGSVGNGLIDRPALWNSDGTVKLLPTLSDPDSHLIAGESARAINNKGQIVGSTYTDHNNQAVLWNDSNATPTVLGALGQNMESNAVAINDAGQIAGWSNIIGGGRHAVFWNSSTSGPTDLGTLGDFMGRGGIPGQASSIATGINADGLIVGKSIYSSPSMSGLDITSFLWDGTHMININSLLPADAVRAGFISSDTVSINNAGVIAGVGNNGVPFLLTPVPEPETWTMLLAGLSLSMVMARRRQNQKNS